MLAEMMLFAAVAGQVLTAHDGRAVVRPASQVAPGEVLTVKRLTPASGAPGRAPFFQWSKAAKVRVVAVRPNGTAEVAVVRGKVVAGDRVVAD